jgi:uncharacterized iron-regulated membrane protein
MKSLYGRLWRWHFFAAVIVVPFVLWQSVTGSLYLWSEWWMDQMHPELRFVSPQPQQQSYPLSEQIQAALKAVGPGAVSPAAVAHDPQHDAASHSAAPGEGGMLDSPTTAAPFAADASAPPTANSLVTSSSVASAPAGAHGSHAANAVASGPAVPHHGIATAGLAVQAVLLPEDPTRSTTVLFQRADGLPFPVFVNPYTGSVLGQLPAAAWLPGISRALHGGWPLGEPGSWLLELGDGWAILMLATGLYLWWPRGRGFAALWPRTGAGTRVLLRDLHSCVAVWFSVVFLFFLISALPWTAFWGGKLLSTIEANTGQKSPTGFSPGGASVAQFANASLPIEQAVITARRAGVHGALDIRLAPWPGAPVFMTNKHVSPSQDRTILADPAAGTLRGDFTNDQIPVIPRMVALGIHVHQADFGPINIGLNTAFAASLIWLTGTGLLSWWKRRPAGSVGAPPKPDAATPLAVKAIVIVAGVLMPLFGVSVALIVLAETGVTCLRPVRTA